MATVAAILDFRSEQIYLVLSTSHIYTSYQVSNELAFRFRRRSKKLDCQNSGHGGQLGFPIVTILAMFALLVTLILSTNFRVIWPFSSGEEAKNRFPGPGRPGRHS